MNGFWKKRIPAFLMALVMMISLMPAASAELNPGYEADSTDHWMPNADDQQRAAHTFSDLHVDKDATCGEAGEKTVVCTVCGYETTVSIPATGAHDFTNGTCEKVSDSKHRRKCNHCGETIEEDHNWNGATPAADGENHTKYCPDCRSTLTEKHTHSASDIGTRKIGSNTITCTINGPTQYTCSVCNELYYETEKLDHIDRNGDNVCDRCGNSMSTGYTITFNTNGGSSVPAQTVTGGGQLPNAISDPSKSGCDFMGWQDSSGSLYTGQSNLLRSSDLNSRVFNSSATFYAIWRVKVSGQSGSVSAGSSIGPTLWNHISGKCSSYFGGSPASVTFESPLPTSTYGTLYLSGTTQVQTGTAYYETSFRGMTFTPGSSGVSYRLYYTARDSSTQNTVSGYVDISAQSAANTISYTVAAGRETYFESSSFQSAFRSAGFSGNFSYVTFPSVSGNYSNFSGRVYNGSTELSASSWSGGRYDYGSSINNLSLRASGSAKSGSFTTTYRVYSSNGTYAEGTLELKVTGSTSKGDVTYSVDAGREVDFDARDFNKAFQNKYGTGRTLYYVRFSAPSGYSSFRGAVYEGSSSFSRSDLNRAYFYYDSRDAGRNDYALDDLSFRAESSARSGDSITIPFQAYYGSGSRDYVDCDLTITIGKGTSGTKGDINYSVDPGKTVNLRARDFRDFYEDNNTDSLDYVVFSQPGSSAFNNGTLYHAYGTSSSKSFTRSSITNVKFYYSPGSKDYDLGDLTFAADNSFRETITLDFTAYGTSGRSARGTVTIASTESSRGGDITYKVTPGKSVDLRRTDFNTFFRKWYSSTVSYVTFQRPSNTNIFNNGTLYCDYGASNQTSFSRNDLGGVRFYYDKSKMGSRDYYLDELTFVANTSFKDSISLEFTAYGENSGDYVDGTLIIQSDGTASVVTSNYTGGIRYATAAGANVQINANDFARYFKKVYPAYTLQYVTLSSVPATGSLYYNYYNASSYGTTSRTQITAANCTGMTLYLSPASTSQYALTELTYVPSGSGYCAGVSFTAYGTGGVSVTGSVLISVSRAKVAEVYGVTPRNTAVNFPASSIYSAVLTATGSALSGIQLLELPAATAGAVYLDTVRADTRTMYTYASGANQMSSLRFIPNATYTGSVEIPYVALDASGRALATGTFSLGVLNNRKTLTDVTSSTWCYKYVMELVDQNVISGYSDGSFKPNSTVTYGAALKLIMLAAGYPEQAPTGSNVFSGYLARAQADGIVTRSNVSLSAPITRLQVAQIAAGALKLSTSNLSSVKPFTDTADASVQALNAAGIVEGYFSNGTSTYRPSSTLTRGQMSAIVWRMNEYRK